jgi:hypothetical protein
VAVETAVLSIGNASPVELSSAGQAYGSAPSRLTVQAPGETLFVGPSGVTTGGGFPVAANTLFTVDLQPGERLFGIIAGLTALDVRVIRSGV